MSDFPGPPKLAPVWKTNTTDGVNWYLLEDFIYNSDIIGRVVVPAMFITDFGSIPREFWDFLPPWGVYGPATIVHDYLYVYKPYTKFQADIILREAMVALGVDHAISEIIYKGVELFGQRAWDKDGDKGISYRTYRP